MASWLAASTCPTAILRPGPKFDYKLAWFERLIAHAQELLTAGVPAVLAGDYNVVPTEADIYPGHHEQENALLQPESRAAFQRLVDQGWTDALRALQPARTAVDVLGLSAQPLGQTTKACGWTISCSAPMWPSASRRRG